MKSICVECKNTFTCIGRIRNICCVPKNNKGCCRCPSCFSKHKEASSHIERGVSCFGKYFLIYFTEEEIEKYLVDSL